MDEEKIVEIEVGLICANNYNPNIVSEDKLIALEDSLKKDGQQQPIIIHESANPICEYQIIDGENRWNIAKKLNWKTIKAIVKEVSIQEAMKLCYTMNANRGNIDLVKEADFFNLLKQQGIKEKDLAKEYGFSEKFVKERLQISKINSEQRELLIKKAKQKKETLDASVWLEYAKLTSEERLEVFKLDFFNVGNMRYTCKSAREHLKERKSFEEAKEKAKFKKCPKCEEPAIKRDWEKHFECKNNHDWDPMTGKGNQQTIKEVKPAEKKKKSLFPRTVWTDLDLDKAAVIAQEKILKNLKVIEQIRFVDKKGQSWAVEFFNHKIQVSNNLGVFDFWHDDTKKAVKVEVYGELTKKNYESTVELISWLGGKLVEGKKVVKKK